MATFWLSRRLWDCICVVLRRAPDLKEAVVRQIKSCALSSPVFFTNHAEKGELQRGAL